MKKIKFKPYTKLILAMLGAILIGSVLLSLPISLQPGVSITYIDALFMATSSICVTGMSVVSDIATTFSPFGIGVIVVLMEMGGLGIITITMFFAILFGAKIGMGSRFELKEILNQNESNGMVKLVVAIIIMSLSIQVVFGIVNFIILLASGMYGVWDSLIIGMFHSASSFNNAGFEIFPDSTSMLAFSDHIALNISTMITVVLGGIGFIVIYDLIQKLVHGKNHKVTYHTKVVLIMTFLLTLVGTILLKVCMGSNITWLEAIFQCVSSRTVGFETVDLNTFNMSALTVMIGLMFIGASPCSAGGGIKTTTLFIICVALFNFARGKSVVVFNRKIDSHSVFKACALFAISVLFVFVAVFVFSLFESGLGFQACLFEVIATFTTVGFSLGITPSLTIGGKIVLCITMLVGRLGPLTIINVLNNNWNKSSEAVGYVEEKMIIG